MRRVPLDRPADPSRRFGRRRPNLAGGLAAVLAAAVLAATGCTSDPRAGYAQKSPYVETIRSVAIPIVENETFVRDVEFELTDALVKEIQARTPYVVTSQARADSILTARIRKVDLRQMSKSRTTGLGEEVVVSVTIDFEWRDAVRDVVLVRRESFTGQGLFLPSRPVGERIELAEFSAAQALARDVVNEMQGAW